MKIALVLLFLFSILVLGYTSYEDAQTKKHQELMKVVHEAEHSLNEIQHNPHTHLNNIKQTQ
ncbi:hypothetical protein [Acinetobacter haemolyticus]|uniref:hypothetical protein n=1 Tax=Acinetobacter haemolyticus TaxID=29430 RepID=UPI000D694F2F|nr:hypothetical protein [Acinetobacter haemolyticus]